MELRVRPLAPHGTDALKCLMQPRASWEFQSSRAMWSPQSAALKCRVQPGVPSWPQAPSGAATLKRCREHRVSGRLFESPTSSMLPAALSYLKCSKSPGDTTGCSPSSESEGKVHSLLHSSLWPGSIKSRWTWTCPSQGTYSPAQAVPVELQRP